MRRQTALIAMFVVGVAVPAMAAPPTKLDASSAMRFGIRAFARIEAGAATPSRIHITCATWSKVGQTRPCSGSFRLTRHGRHADYMLTKRAATFLNSPGSVQFELYAHTDHPAPGLPAGTKGFSGFYQR